MSVNGPPPQRVVRDGDKRSLSQLPPPPPIRTYRMQRQCVETARNDSSYWWILLPLLLAIGCGPIGVSPSKPITPTPIVETIEQGAAK